MWNLTISFGPTGTVWALLFKTEEKAGEAYNAYVNNQMSGIDSDVLIGCDDFGQSYAIAFSEIHAVLLEDLEQIEQARIQRALADERVKAKFMAAARSDPTIMAAARAGQNGPGVLTPFGSR
jgi:hypothetical protein